jgi:mRNA-degrading endonuclease RelE of RelBE toxin-antitoxin system
MASEPSPIQVFYTPEFQRRCKKLKKKYRSIQEDLNPIIKQLEGGNKLGDQVPGVQYKVFKVRVKNSDSRKGTSGGYRVIYRVKSDTVVDLITIYSKSERADIDPKEIRDIILDSEDMPEDDPPSQQQGDSEDMPEDDPPSQQQGETGG